MNHLSKEELARYSRHLCLSGIGQSGQQKLRDASVLLIGAGGLGSPAALYLAAAGVGRMGIVDDDAVEAHNLQRQIMHGTAAVAQAKVDSAAERIADLNPHVAVDAIAQRLTPDNALELFNSYDLIIDGSDNFPTRYLVNDAAFMAQKPLVYGAIFQFEGQVSFFDTAKGTPCYRCLFPEMPEPGSVPNCAEAGVFGALCGMIGSMQAMEAIKHITGAGDTLAGRLQTVDALKPRFHTMRFAKDEQCPLCGKNQRIHNMDTNNYQFTCPTPMKKDELPEEISLQKAAELLQQRPEDLLLLDVREDFEAAICQLPESVRISVRQLPLKLDALPKDKRVLTYCHHGVRSLHAAQLLRSKGITATSMAGGIDGWARQIDPEMPRY